VPQHRVNDRPRLKFFAELVDGVVAPGIRFHDVFAKSCRVGSGTPPGISVCPISPLIGTASQRASERTRRRPWWRRAERALP
jgi:hypothetical protein